MMILRPVIPATNTNTQADQKCCIRKRRVSRGLRLGQGHSSLDEECYGPYPRRLRDSLRRFFLDWLRFYPRVSRSTTRSARIGVDQLGGLLKIKENNEMRRNYGSSFICYFLSLRRSLHSIRENDRYLSKTIDGTEWFTPLPIIMQREINSH